MAQKEELYTLLGKYQELSNVHPKRNQLANEEATEFFIWQCNGLEGSSLKLEDVRDVLTSGVNNVTESNREELEVVGLYEAMQYANRLVAENKELTEEDVKKIHNLLYVGASVEFKGQYRTDFITIPHARNLPPVRHISYFMNQLFEKYQFMQDLDIIERVALFHLEFEEIHPFGDGNGQVGRIIMNYQLQRAGYPFICIHSSKKKEYIKAFEHYYESGKTDSSEMQKIISDALFDELNARIEILSKETEK